MNVGVPLVIVSARRKGITGTWIREDGHFCPFFDGQPPLVVADNIPLGVQNRHAIQYNCSQKGH